MKLNLAQGLLCGGLCTLGYLGWSTVSSSGGEVIAPAARVQRLTRATVEPSLKLTLEIDPFRMSTPGNKTLAASATPELHGPPAPSDLIVAAVDTSATPSVVTESAASATPSAETSATTAAAAATTSGSASVSTASSAPVEPQPGDPAQLDAVLVAGAIGFAIIDGQVRVRGQDWRTPSGTARLVVLAPDRVEVGIDGRVLELTMQRTQTQSVKKPSTARSNAPKRTTRRST